MYQIWAKKLIKNKEWELRYEKDPSYWMLSKMDGGVWIGFLTTNTNDALSKMENRQIELQDNEDMRISDLYRRSNNMSPYPFQTQEEMDWEKRYYNRISKD